MKKIISFSLWGTNPEYLNGAIENSKLQSEIYPDWKCRFYVGTSVPREVIDTLIQTSEVIIMDEPGDWTGMFWRFYPCSDASVGVMISRDADSRLNIREKIMVDEFLASPKSFHSIKDHPLHIADVMGGMFGCKYPRLMNMVQEINKFQKEDRIQTDQEFLAQVIYPKIKDDCLCHDMNYPVKLPNGMFVGQQFKADNTPYEEPR